MKRALREVLTSIILVFPALLQSQDYYYSNDREVYFAREFERYIVHFSEESTQLERESFLSENELSTTTIDFQHSDYALIEVRGASDEEIKNLETDNAVNRVLDLYRTDATQFAILDRIVLKVKRSDPDVLKVLISQYSLELVEKKWLGDNVYVLSLSQFSAESPLAIANKIYESGLVDFCHPDFLTVDWTETNDTHYSSQWNLPKISASDAWGITTGSSSIIIAILDVGVESDHPDLDGHLVTGYDVVDDDNTTDPYGDFHHGTACAGIAAAETNNGTGIAGVGYNCKIMPVQLSHTSNFGNATDFAAGIVWAANHDADVISISGHTNSSDVVNNAIDYATSEGRDDKGCIIVKSAGNTGGDITFPGEHPDVITVGATDTDDDRYSYSSYGDALDVMAPSGHYGYQDFYATDLTGSDGLNDDLRPVGGPADLVSDKAYTKWFDGTSAATPQVAGLAGLILSVDNSLTQESVREIIEYTTDDINTPGFDIETGWGRVNAYGAVKSVDLDFTTSGTLPASEIWSGTVTLTGDVTVPSDKRLTIREGATIRVADGKKIIVDGTLNAYNATFTASNNSWKGIQFNSGSDGTIHESDILHVGSGSANIAIYNASPTIQYNTIDEWEGASYGIFVSGSNAEPNINDNDITVDVAAGVVFTNYAEVNNFDDNIIRAPSGGSAISAYSQAAVYSLDANKLGGGYYPLLANNATIAIHYSHWCSPLGYNHIYAYSYATVDADHNYFPDGDPEVYEDYTSSVDVSYPSSSNYSCNGIPKVAAAGNSRDRGMSEIAAEPDSPLSQGWEALRQRKPEEAYRIFKNIVTTTKDTSLAHQALRGLAHTFTASKESSLLDELIASAGQPGLLQAAAQQVIVHAYRVLDDKEAALNEATKLYTQYPESEFAEFGRRAALYLLWELDRDDEAAVLRASITPADELELAELRIMESLLTGQNVDTSEWSTKSADAKTVQTLPAAYELFVNYPNPFNPSTTIRYSVPQLSTVTLKVYDISGRLVSELVNGDIEASMHTVDFDGSSLASGIYIYKIKAKSLESNKEFSKVGRMILLK